MSPSRRATPPAPAFVRLSLEEALERLRDEHVVAGQTLRDGAGFKVDERGGGLWVAKYAEFETELQLTGRKLKDYRCDCPDFTEHQQCPHLAALLAVVHLRKQPRARAAGASPAKRQVVSIKRLLNSIDEHELREFVAQYARGHAEFALDLKVRFAQSLTINNRFEQVVTNLLSRSGKRFSPREAKRITDALNQFAGQREAWLAEKAFLDLYELNTTLIPKLVVLISKSERVRVDLAKYVSTCIDELAAIVQAGPPPVLIERIEAWLAPELERGAYYRAGVDPALYRLQDALDTDVEAIVAAIGAANERFGISESRVEAQMHLYYAHDLAGEAERLLIDHLDQPRLVSGALQAEVAAGNFERGVRLATAALRHQEGDENRLRLQQFLLAVAQAAGDPQLLSAYGPPVTYGTGELDALLSATEAASDTDREAALRATLDGLPGSGMREDQLRALRARLLYSLGEYQDLEAELYRSQDERVIREFLPQLSGKLGDEDFRLLLETKIREQLGQHFGKAPAQWVASLVDEVARRSRQDVTTAIVSQLRKDFKQRDALIDALDAALL